MSWMRRCIKEPFCGVSHLLGAMLAVAALVMLLTRADGRPWHVVGFAIYGVTLILLYAASAMSTVGRAGSFGSVTSVGATSDWISIRSMIDSVAGSAAKPTWSIPRTASRNTRNRLAFASATVSSRVSSVGLPN